MAKPAEKKQAIIDSIKSRIVSGELAPGERLPTRVEIQEEFEVSKGTLQTAFDVLTETGFIYSRGSKGTCVSERPPHLSNFAVVFQKGPEGDSYGWGKFQSLFLRACREVSGHSGCNLEPYFNFSEGRSSKDYQRLEQKLKENRVAGILFSHHPVHGMELVQEFDAAYVTVRTSTVALSSPRSHNIYIDFESFYRRAKDLFRKLGRHRLGMFTHLRDMKLVSAGLGNLMGWKLHTYNHWIQMHSPYYTESIRNCANLMMKLPKKERPDAILVDNDNFVRGILAGFSDAGAEIGKDIEVICHWNFLDSPPEELPIHWLGFDLTDIIKKSITSLKKQMSRKKTKSSDHFSRAVFLEEWKER